MKQNRKSVLRSMRLVLILLFVVLLTGAMFACNNTTATVSTVELVESSNTGFYYLDGFSIANFKLLVTYDDDTTATINAANSMLTTEDRNALKTTGQKSVTLRYQGKAVVVEFYLAGPEDELVKITFNDEMNVTIESRTALKGSEIVPPDAPEVEGLDFKAWVEKDGTTEWKASDFKSVQKSVTLTASYVAQSVKYTVTFKDYKGNVVESASIAEGELVNPPTYEKPAEVASYNWGEGVTFPYKVTGNVTFKMSIVAQKYLVQYAYAVETKPSELTYLEQYKEEVVYGEKVSNYDKAKSAVNGTIAQESSANKTIYDKTTFVFLIAAPRADIVVYDNATGTIVKVAKSSYRVGDEFKFPAGTGETVVGKTFIGWKIYNSNKTKSSELYKSEGTWTVDQTYGDNIIILPCYQATTATVNFEFAFTDMGDYTAKKVVSDYFVPGDEETGYITYAYVASLLQTIKNNNGKDILDGTATQVSTAKEILSYCEIASVKVKIGTDETVLTSAKNIKITATNVVVSVKLKNMDSGTVGIDYEKVLVIDRAPEVILPVGDEIDSWYYNGEQIIAFPFVYDNASTFDASKLKYKTKLITSSPAGPGYVQIDTTEIIGKEFKKGDGYYVNKSGTYEDAALITNTYPKFVSGETYYTKTLSGEYEEETVVVGNAIEEKKYYVWDTKTKQYVFAESLFVPSFEQGVNYYAYYLPAGYIKVTVEAGTKIPESEEVIYYTYDASTFTKAEGTFMGGTDYYTYQLVENNGYYTGYKATGINGSYVAGSIIYIPDSYKKSGDKKAYPVVSIGDNVFGKEHPENEEDYTYTIAKISSNLIEIGANAFSTCLFSGVSDFNKVKIINSYAFQYAGLTGTVTFNHVEVLGTDCFYKVNNFSKNVSLTLDLGEDIQVISGIKGIKNNLSVKLGGQKVAIRENTFAESSGLISIKGFENTLIIEDNAFKGTSLTSVNFPNLVEIGETVFSDMEELKVVSIGANGKIETVTIDLSIIEGSYHVTTLAIGKTEEKITVQNASEEEPIWDKYTTDIINTISDNGKYELQELYLPASVERAISTEEGYDSIFDTFNYLEKIAIPSVSKNFYTDDGVLYMIKTSGDKFENNKSYFVYDERTKEYVKDETVVAGDVIPEGKYYVSVGVGQYKLAEENYSKQYEYELYRYPENKVGVYEAKLPYNANTLTIEKASLGSAIIASIDLRLIPDTVSVSVSQNQKTKNPTIYAVLTRTLKKESVANLVDLGATYIDNTSLTKNNIASIVTSNSWDAKKVFLFDDYMYYYDTANKLLFELQESATAKTASVVAGYSYAEEITVPAVITKSGKTYTINGIQAKAFYGFERLKKLTVNANLAYLPYDRQPDCQTCGGDGLVECEECHGVGCEECDEGYTECPDCVGLGNNYTATIFGGKEICPSCSGVGCVDCTDGYITVSCNNLTDIFFAPWSSEAILSDEVTEENNVTTIVKYATVWSTSFKNTAWYGKHNIIYAGNHPFSFNNDNDIKEISAQDLSDSGFTDTISAEFFAGSAITSIELPASIKTIGYQAFKDCIYLKTVDFNQVKDIKSNAFEGCTSLESVTANYLESLSDYAFKGCSSLEKVVMPKLTIMPVGAFLDCSSLGINGAKVDVSGVIRFSTSTEGSKAFQGCSSLTGIALPNYTSDIIPEYTFEGCSSLKAMDFKNSFKTVKTISNSAFANCDNLEYLAIGPQVISIGDKAFDSCSVNLCVEISYATGALYSAKTEEAEFFTGTYNDIEVKVYKNAFDDNATFYIDASTDRTNTFLGNKNSSNIKTTCPTISFVFDDPDKYPGLTLNLSDINDKIYFTESDFVAPIFNGYKFVEWTTSGGQKLEYPCILTQSQQILAKYYSLEQGTLDKDNDVKFIYLISEYPEIPLGGSTNSAITALSDYTVSDGVLEINDTQLKEIMNACGYKDYDKDGVDYDAEDIDAFFAILAGLEFGEELSYTYYKNGVEIESDKIWSDKVITDVTSEDVITMKVTVTSYYFSYISGVNPVKKNEVNKEYEFEDVGEFGYAITDYTSVDGNNIYLPDEYNNALYGKYKIIAVYAGAFGDSNLIMTSLALPKYTKVVLQGKYDNQTSTLSTTGSFNENLVNLTIPEATIYMDSEILTDAEALETIVFEGNSYVKNIFVDTFNPTLWYENAVLSAERGENNGFVLAGHTAIEYVGYTDTVFVSKLDNNNTYYSEAGLTYGINVRDEQGKVQTAQVLVAEIIGGVCVFQGQGAFDNDGIYTATFNLMDGDEIEISNALVIKLNEDRFGAYKENSAKVTLANDLVTKLNNVSNVISAIGIRFHSKSPVSIVVPASTKELADNILEGYSEITSVTLNKGLIKIGDNAFKNCTGLKAVQYDKGEDVGNLTTIGTDAFVGTPWYSDNESVEIGGIYVKYNNIGNGTTLTVPSTVRIVAKGAFANATKLTEVMFGGNKVTTIEDGAFEGSAIARIKLPSSVKTVGRGIFKNCTKLIDADLSEVQIASLPQDTFFGCSLLKSVKLATTVTALEKNSLYGATVLETIMANGITEIDSAESKLNCTAWFNPGQKNANQYLILGKVLVKFILGKDAIDAVDGKTGEEAKIAVTIGAVNTIEESAFSAETNNKAYITSVSIPSDVTLIEKNAFKGMEKLEKVEFATGSKLTTIEESAFEGCSALTTVVLPEGLKTIGNNAFKSTKLTTTVEKDGILVSDDGFKIPDTVTEIGSYAFGGIKTLTYVKLGSALEKLGIGAFGAIDGDLYKVVWVVDVAELEDTADKHYTDEEKKSKLQRLTDYLIAQNVNNVDKDKILSTIFVTATATIKIRLYFEKDSLNYINNLQGDYRSVWNQGNESSTLIKEVGDYPKITLKDGEDDLGEFNEEYLKENTIPKQEKVGYTFKQWKLNDSPITYPYEVRQDSIILKAEWVNNNPASLESLGEGYSVDSGVITSVPGDLETLYVYETIGGTKITGINVVNSSVETLIFTKAENFNGNEGGNPFAGFSGLKKVLMPNDETKADFMVEDIEISYTTGVGENATTTKYSFQVVFSRDKTKLISFIGQAPKEAGKETYIPLVYNVPSSVTEIYQGAFVNSHLDTIYLPKSVKKIGDNVFDDVKAIRMQDGIQITNAASAMFKNIAEGSFYQEEVNASKYSHPANSDYTEVKGARYPSGMGNFFVLGNILLQYTNTETTNIGELVCPDTAAGIDVTVLAEKAFKNAGAKITVSTLTLPTNITLINSNVFENIDVQSVAGNKESSKYKKLNSIADSVFDNLSFYTDGTEIILGNVYVRYANTATSITIPQRVKEIMKGAFNGRQNLSKVEFESGSNLTKIGSEAFYNCRILETITIPNTVTEIGESAFASCINLQTVSLKVTSGGSALSTIGASAFAGCTSLTTLYLPKSLQIIGDNAFDGCTGLKSISFNECREESNTEQDGTTTYKLVPIANTSNLSKIGANAFNGCTGLVTITIPNGIQTIAEYTFIGCSNLETVVFDNTNSKLKTIERYAFQDCVKLGSKITLPEGYNTKSDDEKIKYITSNRLLLTVSLPNSLETVAEGAFKGCSGLWGIEFNYSLKELGSKVFDGCTHLARIDFAKSTPPTIQNDTFGSESTSNNLFRLRIYVPKSSGSGSIGTTMQSYITKWENATIKVGADDVNIKYFIYQTGDLPSLTYEATVSGETQPAKTVQTDLFIAEYGGARNIFGASSDSWYYYSLSQNATWYYDSNDSTTAIDSTRATKKLGDNIYSGVNLIVEIDGTNYVIVVVDYDNVIIKNATQQ